MILFMVLLAAQIKAAAPPSGQMIFAQQCSVPYCHGAGGTASRAPALAGRSFTREQLFETISKGRPKLGMPSFASKLDKTALDAVVAYVASLQVPAGGKGESAHAPAIKLSKEEIAGRYLFFDSERLPSCATCHSVNGVGGNIAPAITTTKFTRQSLENVTAPGVVTAEVKGEAPFLAMLQPAAPAGSVRLADLSSPLPVVRTFPEGDVKLSSAQDWKHSSVVDRYSASEIQSILVWLRAVLPAE